MSYTPTSWKTGDTITAEKLNKMESGIEAASDSRYVVNFDDSLQQTDKTFREVKNAFLAGKNVVIRFERDYKERFLTLLSIIYPLEDGGEYDEYSIEVGNSTMYAVTIDDYLVIAD